VALHEGGALREGNHNRGIPRSAIVEWLRREGLWSHVSSESPAVLFSSPEPEGAPAPHAQFGLDPQLKQMLKTGGESKFLELKQGISKVKDVDGKKTGMKRVLATVLIALAVVTLLLGALPLVVQWRARIVGPTFLSLSITGLFLVAQGFVLSYLGDAARYLSPRPRNIALRQKIRSEGLKLFRSLHASGEYDRIVVVGHSLGSVIGYDLITHLWQEYNERLEGLSDSKVQGRIRQCMAEVAPTDSARPTFSVRRIARLGQR
jgi:hypothetical protein